MEYDLAISVDRESGWSPEDTLERCRNGRDVGISIGGGAASAGLAAKLRELPDVWLTDYR